MFAAAGTPVLRCARSTLSEPVPFAEYQSSCVALLKKNLFALPLSFQAVALFSVPPVAADVVNWLAVRGFEAPAGRLRPLTSRRTKSPLLKSLMVKLSLI